MHHVDLFFNDTFLAAGRETSGESASKTDLTDCTVPLQKLHRTTAEQESVRLPVHFRRAV